MATSLTFNRYTTVGINPTLISGIITFCDNLCFETSKKLVHSFDLSNNMNKIIIRIYL